MVYHIFSGELHNNNKGISLNNRAFRYADGLFESMYFTNGRIMFLEQHYTRLLSGMAALRIDSNNLPSMDDILEMLKELLSANEISTSARLRLQVFRKAGGLYAPKNRDCDYIIEARELQNTDYLINNKGLHIGIASNVQISNSPFNKYKTINKQEIVLAAMEAQDNKWDDALLLNSKGNIVESTSSNIFIVKNNILYCPPENDGALNGIMRQNIIALCNQNGIRFTETHLKPSDLGSADEIFLTNAIKGIQWVVAYKNKRYFNTTAKHLINILNKEIYA